jgi:cyclopropane-fatty-acyl-phospholipid synthase
MKTAHRSLVDGGIFLYHSIGGSWSDDVIEPWLDKYIFPHAVLPSIAQLGKSFENLFVMEDWHNFGPYYDKTLLAWFENFEKSWPELKDKYGDRFYRMWKYYLLMSAGSFRSRYIQLWQIVLSKGGVEGGYTSVR